MTTRPPTRDRGPSACREKQGAATMGEVAKPGVTVLYPVAREETPMGPDVWAVVIAAISLGW